MKIYVKYFAALRDERGADEDVVEDAPSTPEEVYSLLKEKYSLSFCKSRLKVAVNDDFSNWDTKLSDGDSLVFIPPVAGG